MRRFRRQLARTYAQPGRAQVPAPTVLALRAAPAFRPTLPSRTSPHLRIDLALQALAAPRLPRPSVALSPVPRDDEGRDEIGNWLRLSRKGLSYKEFRIPLAHDHDERVPMTHGSQRPAAILLTMAANGVETGTQLVSTHRVGNSQFRKSARNVCFCS